MVWLCQLLHEILTQLIIIMLKVFPEALPDAWLCFAIIIHKIFTIKLSN
jgi:hypothetical protein